AIEPLHAARGGWRDQTKIRIRAGGDCRFGFLFHRRKRDDLLAVEVATAFGRDLIFKMNGSTANAFELADRPNEIDSVTVAGVGVGDNGNFYSRYHLGGALDDFRHCD